MKNKSSSKNNLDTKSEQGTPGKKNQKSLKLNFNFNTSHSRTNSVSKSNVVNTGSSANTYNNTNSNCNSNVVTETSIFAKTIISKPIFKVMNNVNMNNCTNLVSYSPVIQKRKLTAIGGSDHLTELNKFLKEGVISTKHKRTASLTLGIRSENTNNTIKENSQLNNQNKSINLKVVVRFRPLNEVETELIRNNVGHICIEFPEDSNNTVIVKNENANESSYKFDKIFRMESTQEEVYNLIGRETTLDVLSGYNGTIFTYGQSGSGKTHTMYGIDIYDQMSSGIIPRIISHIFEVINSSEDDVIYQVKLSALQIYKEVIYDLLTGEKDLKIKENPVKGIYVDGLSEVFIDSEDSFLEYIELSQNQKIVTRTKLNQYSNRSHSILIMELTQTSGKDNLTKKGTLNLIDLAGSEKVSKTGAIGEILEEAKKINLSLSSLGNVIHAITNNSDHVPYRESKLTRILQESLGGNFKTSLIVTCSPHSYNLEETSSSLKFAQRAKSIKNKVKMNIRISYEELQKMVDSMRSQLECARNEVVHLRDVAGVVCESGNITYSGSINNTNKFTCESSDGYFGFCSVPEHKDRIAMLTNQIENLHCEIKEKDDTIMKLEEEVRMLNKTNKKLSKGVKNDLSQINEVKEKDPKVEIVNFYEEIKNKLSEFKNEKVVESLGCLNVNKERENILNLYAEIHEKLKSQNNLSDVIDSLLKNKISLNKNFLRDLKRGCESIMNFTNEDEKKEIQNLLIKLVMQNINITFNLALSERMNEYLKIQNDKLREENQLIINIVEELLKSNFEMSNENLSNLHSSIQTPVQNMKKSVTFAVDRGSTVDYNNVLASLENNEVLQTQHNQNQKNSFMNIEAENECSPCSPKVKRPNMKNSAKFEKFISKKNLSIMRSMHGGMISSFVNQPEEKISNNNYTNFMISSPVNKASSFCKTASILIKSEKKMSKFLMLRDFIVNSIKENEKLKNVFNCIKEDCNKLTKQVEKIIVNKINGQENEIEYSDEENKIEDVKSYENKLPENIGDNILISKSHSNSNSNSNFKKNMNFVRHDIEDLINDYIETGTATRYIYHYDKQYIFNYFRKFDGISVKNDQDHMKWYFNGGLNAENKITKCPLDKQLSIIPGDSSVRMDDSLLN